MSSSHPSLPEVADLTDVAMSLRCLTTVLLAVALCFLPCITSSLSLEDPNVCSHWERSVSMMQPFLQVHFFDLGEICKATAKQIHTDRQKRPNREKYVDRIQLCWHNKEE